MNPTACKVNVQEDETYEVRLVMPISSEVQIEQAEILQGVELTNSFIPVEQPIQEMVIEILEPDVIDWTISQFLFAGSAEGTLTLEISQESYDEIEPMIEFLDSRGIIIHVL
jgi:3-methyladenine DNA glycosylase AlkD